MSPSATRRLVINGRFLGRPATGVDRFAFETVRAIDALLDAQDPIVTALTVELVAPAHVGRSQSPFHHIPVRSAGRGRGTYWEQLSLPFAANGSLLLNLCNSGPLVYRRQVTVLHDAAPVRVPQSYSSAFSAWYRWMAPTIGRVARRIVTVSEFSRSELYEAYGIPANKIGVVHESGEHMLRVPATQRHPCSDATRPYVLAVGSSNQHKNFRLIVESARLMSGAPFDIVVVGGTDPRVYGSGQAALPSFVRHLGYVSDADLGALYRDAACFVFPSRYEGFGLPPVEAMALGCPVVASRLPSIVEACGDAALYFSPDDPHELAEVLHRVASDEALRDRMRRKGRARSARLTWRATAVALLEEISPWLN
ncbi:MAG: glycosyltransferase family 1 protein [Paraburkholderia sp.]|nr:MAG: glycosyltransferase family 1 protein [Paraburkholderia sp.]TAM31938.1 MAG: glycosyltransferase family 1 protein [Paraburkholderia sp.]